MTWEGIQFGYLRVLPSEDVVASGHPSVRSDHAIIGSRNRHTGSEQQAEKKMPINQLTKNANPKAKPGQPSRPNNRQARDKEERRAERGQRIGLPSIVVIRGPSSSLLRHRPFSCRTEIENEKEGLW